MLQNITYLMSKWNEAERYKPNNNISHIEIENVINNLEGFLIWIEKS